MDNELTCSDSTWIIDRFEEDYAVLENAATLKTISLPKSSLFDNARPGDTLVWRSGTWHFNHNETEARRQRIQERLNRIKARK